MQKLLKTLLNPRYTPHMICAATAGALAFVLIAEYGFDIKPCILCLWQRLPFGLSFMLSLFLVMKNGREIVAPALFIIAALFLANTGLAIFHTGVEQHWWAGTSGCALRPLSATSLDDMRQQLLNLTVARCDQIAWTFLGLSMTNWNIALSFGLAVYSFIAGLRLKQQK